MRKIYIIHENSEWTEPLRNELKKRDLPFDEWFLDGGHFDLSEAPPEGVYYNRMSASSHTRDHRYAPEYSACVIAWLEMYGRRVCNTSRALQLEINKIAQYAALDAYGVKTPRTIAAVGKKNIVEAAGVFKKPFITKHNRAGKGLGVQKFENVSALASYVNGGLFEESVDGVTLLQDYIEAPTPHITRCEFIGGKFYYAVRVDASKGFQLCPADACQIGDEFCPTTESTETKFQVVENFKNPITDKYETFLRQNGITFAGIEFIEDKNGEIYTYDVNTNTNYNFAAESAAGVSGMGAIAAFLGNELAKL
ncbi:glutathione synthase [Synergistales bacterium]|nr:glutathione synthase [Synergistales bacterium]